MVPLFPFIQTPTFRVGKNQLACRKDNRKRAAFHFESQAAHARQAIQSLFKLDALIPRGIDLVLKMSRVMRTATLNLLGPHRRAPALV